VDLQILNEVGKFAFIIKQKNKVFSNKKAIELLELNKRTILNDLNKIPEIREFFASSKSTFKRTIKLRNKIETKYVSLYIKKLPEGFILIAEDFTKQMREKQILDVIAYLQDVLLKANDEKSLFKRFIKAVIKKAGFNACVVLKKEGNKLVPKYFGGDFEDLKSLTHTEIPLIDPEMKNIPAIKAFRSGKIVFNDDTRVNPDMKPLKEELLKRNYLSSVAIPVFLNSKVEAVICICKDEVDFFKGYKKLLEYISKFLSHALERINDVVFKDILLHAINKGHEWVVITDRDANILFANETVEKITGYKITELIGKNPRIFKSGRHDEIFYKEMWDTILKGKIYENVIINKKKDGSLFYLLDKIVPVKEYFISLGKDITNEKKYFHLIEELKFKDPVTGLYNKEGFFKNAREYLKKYKYESHMILIVDIHNFNALNHKYGINFGDKVLQEVSHRLKEIFFDRDLIYKINEHQVTLGRFNGDEFAIFLQKITEDAIPKILNKLYEIFTHEFTINGVKLKLDYNAGISIYPKDAKEIDKLLNNASIALLNAKKEGPNIVKMYSKEYSDEIFKYNDVLNLIKSALEKDQFRLHYQPVVDTQNEEIVGAEALLRIEKDGKIITPGVFIEVLENSYYTKDVSLKMLDEIEEVLKKTKNIKISYNICEKQFRSDEVLEKLIRLGKKYKNRLQIEIIERVLLHETEYSVNILNKLKKNGLKIAIDDFGTGYSSLSYLRELPVDVLKIDITFIRKMMENTKDLAVVKTIITLAKELEMETVAEGVEDEKQVAILKALGCDYMQGFYYYRPLPKDEFLKLV